PKPARADDPQRAIAPSAMAGSDGATGRAPSPALAPPTLEAMPPLAMPPLTMPSMEASSALAAALTALETDVDADACIRAGRDLAAEAPNDPRVLRLAGKALALSAPSGQMPQDGVELFVAQAPKHG